MAPGPSQLPEVGPWGRLDGRHPTPSQFFSLNITEGHVPADLKEARQKSRQPVSSRICEIRESGGQSGVWRGLQLSPSPYLSGGLLTLPPTAVRSQQLLEPVEIHYRPLVSATTKELCPARRRIKQK